MIHIYIKVYKSIMCNTNRLLLVISALNYTLKPVGGKLHIIRCNVKLTKYLIVVVSLKQKFRIEVRIPLSVQVVELQASFALKIKYIKIKYKRRIIKHNTFYISHISQFKRLLNIKLLILVRRTACVSLS